MVSSLKEYSSSDMIRGTPDLSMVDPMDNPKIASLAGMAYATLMIGGPDLGPLDLF